MTLGVQREAHNYILASSALWKGLRDVKHSSPVVPLLFRDHQEISARCAITDTPKQCFPYFHSLIASKKESRRSNMTLELGALWTDSDCACPRKLFGPQNMYGNRRAPPQVQPQNSTRRSTGASLPVTRGSSFISSTLSSAPQGLLPTMTSLSGKLSEHGVDIPDWEPCACAHDFLTGNFQEHRDANS